MNGNKSCLPLSVFYLMITYSLALSLHSNQRTHSHPQKTPLRHNDARTHDFYALENVNVVSQSQSIKAMNNCKRSCLKMGQYFPFKFKYHRYVLRQKIGDGKYFEGTCHFSLKQLEQDKWYPWEKLKIFITGTKVLPDMSELQIWEKFKNQCEENALKMDKSTLDGLEYTRVHSNFEYRDDGTFLNLEPFNDINDMLDNLGLGNLGSDD